MRKAIPFLVVSLLIFLALIPPINWFISRPENDAWYIIVLGMAFFGVFTVFIETDWRIKVVAIWSFVLCMTCGSPLVALTSYASIIVCCYLYIMCLKIEDWSLVFKSLQTLLILNVLIVMLQALGRDPLLNFGLDAKHLNTYGIIGQHMQMGSFSVVLSAALLPFNDANMIFPFVMAVFCSSSWTVLAASSGLFLLIFNISKRGAVILLVLCTIGFCLFAWHTHKFEANLTPTSGRAHVWKTSLAIAMRHPWTGWGAGTYKLMYPVLSRTQDIPYKTAHNWLIQLVFEMGIPFSLFLLSVLLQMAYALWQAKEWPCLAGFVMIFIDAEVHFPDRMLQTVGIIICFLAYCQTRLNQAARARQRGYHQ